MFIIYTIANHIKVVEPKHNIGNEDGPQCKMANISVERFMDRDVCKLTCDDHTKGILYELNQYNGWILLLPSTKIGNVKSNLIKIGQIMCQT